ncbi:MAG: hypothetical protein BJ554DRAFT_4849 [Olpidium bornovanus]|uniref:DUF155 domain-containing protein n=1 Tax=Olpidium bornovanus TaxID=278681 RepID=A0A8H7ZLE8_9FUNG|nr:MAG: hypothetical protein BJ554DRAFT_4849 [Olpidium bornovanus]
MMVTRRASLGLNHAPEQRPEYVEESVRPDDVKGFRAQRDAMLDVADENSRFPPARPGNVTRGLETKRTSPQPRAPTTLEPAAAMHRRRHDYQSLLPASPQHHQPRPEHQLLQPHYGPSQHHHQYHALDGHRAWHHGAQSGGAAAGHQDAAPETWSQQQPPVRRPTARTTPALNLPPPAVRPKPKQPNRTTKTSQKLTLFPEDNEYDSTVRHDQSTATGNDRLYAPYPRAGEAAAVVPQMPHGNARLEAERLSKLDRRWLPRVAAYCTARSVWLPVRNLCSSLLDVRSVALAHFGNVSALSGAAAGVATRDGWSGPLGQHQQQQNQQADGDTTEDLRPTPAEHKAQEAVGGSDGSGGSVTDVKLGYAGSDSESDAATGGSNRASKPRSQRNFSRGRAPSLQSVTRVADSVPAIPFSVAALMHPSFGEIFYFEYGVVVMWGFTDEEERKLLKEVAQFEEEKLAVDDMETEQFHFHYNDSYQPRYAAGVVNDGRLTGLCPFPSKSSSLIFILDMRTACYLQHIQRRDYT